MPSMDNITALQEGAKRKQVIDELYETFEENFVKCNGSREEM